MTLLPLGSKVRLLSGIALLDRVIHNNTLGIVTNNFSNDWGDDEGLAASCLAVKFEGQIRSIIIFHSGVALVPHKPTEEEIDELI